MQLDRSTDQVSFCSLTCLYLVMVNEMYGNTMCAVVIQFVFQQYSFYKTMIMIPYFLSDGIYTVNDHV